MRLIRALYMKRLSLKRWHRWVIAAVLILFLAITLWRFDAGNVLHSLRQIPLWLVGLLVGLQIISQLLVNTLWFQIAKLADTPISFGRMLYVNCQGAVMDSITPGVKFGGEITRAVQISRAANCDGGQAATVVALQKLFSLSSFFFILLFAAGLLVGGVIVWGLLLLPLLLFMGVLLAPQRVQIFLESRYFAKPSNLAWIRRVRGFLLATLERLIAIRSDKKKMAMLLVLSFVMWFLYPVKLYLIAVQFVHETSVIYIGASGFVAYMVAMLPLFPGGLGGFEGSLSGLLAALGFVLSDAVVVAVLFRFITFWLVMLGSLGFIAVHKISAKFARN